MDAQYDLKLTLQATHAAWLPDMKEWKFAALVISPFFTELVIIYPNRGWHCDKKLQITTSTIYFDL